MKIIIFCLTFALEDGSIFWNDGALIFNGYYSGEGGILPGDWLLSEDSLNEMGKKWEKRQRRENRNVVWKNF